MATYSNEDLSDELNDLTRLDYDAIEAYRAAIERLESGEYRRQLGEFMKDHQRHTTVLAEEVRALGGIPDDGPGGLRMLSEGAVRLGAIADDKGILHAMNTNEAVINRSYESALEKLEGYPVHAVVARNHEDQRRHKAWIEAELMKD